MNAADLAVFMEHTLLEAADQVRRGDFVEGLTVMSQAARAWHANGQPTETPDAAAVLVEGADA